jgi:hypothetical protein
LSAWIPILISTFLLLFGDSWPNTPEMEWKMKLRVILRRTERLKRVVGEEARRR